MQFGRCGDYLSVSRITGPRHNLLQLKLGEGLPLQPVCECLDAKHQKQYEPLCESKIIAAVFDGLAKANQRFGTSYAVAQIRYIDSDSKPETIYSEMTLKLIEHLHTGGNLGQAESAF